MKNRIAFVVGMVSTLAMAQDFSPTPFGESSETSTPAPVFSAPADPAPASAAAGPADFDKLRGNAYYLGTFGNMAGAFTVNDYLYWPHLMGGEKFLYVEPTSESGTVAAPLGKMTVFLNLANVGAGTIGQTTIGVAQGNKFGASLTVGRDWERTATDPAVGDETTTYETGEGDVIGLRFSTEMSGNALAAYFEWVTEDDQTVTNNSEESNYTLSGGVDFSNYPNAKDMFWSTGLHFDRRKNTTDPTPGAIQIDPSTNWQFTGLFNLGKKILGADDARVLIGLDNSVIVTKYTDIDNNRQGVWVGDIVMAPNLVGEFSVNQNWMFFGGARHAIEVLGFGIGDDMGPTNQVTQSEMVLRQYTNLTTARIGARFEYKRLACEAAFSDNLFSNGVSEIFQGANLLATFGAFLYF